MSAQPQPPLKLVKPVQRRNLDAIPLERRVSHRHRIHGQVTSLQTTNDPLERRNRICSLELRNLSDTGMGAVSQEPILIDTRIVVFFPPHGPEKGFDLHGQVIRCASREHGHDIGIRFETRHYNAA